MNLTRLALIALVVVPAACGPAPIPVSQTAASTRSPRPGPTSESTLAPPAITATPAPAAREFTEEFNSTPPYWVSFQTSGAGLDLQVQGGWLVFNLGGANNWAYAVYAGQDYADVRVEALVESRLGEDNTLGLVCRYDEKQGWYEFNIHPDRTYMLLYGQWLGDGRARYEPLYRGSSEKILSGGPNRIGLLCQAGTLTPFVNGVQLRKWDEKKYALTRGRIGLTASSFEDLPAAAAVDWLQVGEP